MVDGYSFFLRLGHTAQMNLVSTYFFKMTKFLLYAVVECIPKLAYFSPARYIYFAT